MQLHDIEVERDVDTSLMRWPMREILTGEDGENVNRLFCNLAGISWATVELLIEYEERKLSRIEAGEDDADDESEDEDCDEWDDVKNLLGLDPGVASAVGALSASNCFPVSSCNGEPGHTEPVPCVLFRARVARVPDLLEVAEEAGCGLINNGERLELYAPHVRHLVAFARAMLARRQHLRPLYRRGQGGRRRNGRQKQNNIPASQLQLF